MRTHPLVWFRIQDSILNSFQYISWGSCSVCGCHICGSQPLPLRPHPALPRAACPGTLEVFSVTTPQLSGSHFPNERLNPGPW